MGEQEYINRVDVVAGPTLSPGIVYFYTNKGNISKFGTSTTYGLPVQLYPPDPSYGMVGLRYYYSLDNGYKLFERMGIIWMAMHF